MARRSDHSREVLTEMALEAARGIVEEQGLEQLTARAIARRIGYSPGSLYNLFENLDHLVAALNTRTLEALAEALRDALSGVEEPDVRVRRLCAAYIGFCSRHRGLWRAVIERRAAGSAGGEGAFTVVSETLFAAAERELAPFVGGDDPQRLGKTARMLWAAIDGIATNDAAGALQPITGYTALDLADTLAVGYLRGLRA